MEAIEKLLVVFSRGPLIRETLETDPTGTRMLGRGLFLSQLEEMGFNKKELQRLCDGGILKKTTTMVQKSWRTTYVLLGSK